MIVGRDYFRILMYIYDVTFLLFKFLTSGLCIFFLGPFWICVTLVFTTAVAGNIANYMLLHDYEKQYEWRYDFHKGKTSSISRIFKINSFQI